MSRILFVGGKRDLWSAVSRSLRGMGHDVTAASGVEDALLLARRDAIDLAVVDQGCGEARCLDFLRILKHERNRTAVVVAAADGSIESAVEAVQLGAKDYLAGPFDTRELVAAFAKALADRERGDTDTRRRWSESDCSESCGMVGCSRALRDLMDLVERVAVTDSTVLITGETGTGKERVGRAIHKLSSRASRAFSVVKSAAFPETLLESELFGHQRGAFAGAASSCKGLFESAQRGTVFLDEVGAMPLSTQAKILRFLQTGEIRPLGGESTRYVDVRLLAATNEDLEEAVAAGRFSEDLYYRLAVIPLRVPPLRERLEDVPLLVEDFLDRLAERAGTAAVGVQAAARDLLTAYSWPGNVRQLENAIERGVMLRRGPEITAEDLPAYLRESSPVREGEPIQSLRVMERAHILRALDHVGWNRKRAAELLQISTTTLWRRLKQFGLEPDRGRRVPPPPAPRS